MKNLFTIFALIFSLHAQANYHPECGTDYRELVKSSITDYSTKRSKVLSYQSALLDLKAVELIAFDYFLNGFQITQAFPFEDEFDLYQVESFKYFKKGTNRLKGYRVDITDLSNDDTTVRYYIGLSGNKKPVILYSYSADDSDFNKWICEGYGKNKIPSRKDIHDFIEKIRGSNLRPEDIKNQLGANHFMQIDLSLLPSEALKQVYQKTQLEEELNSRGHAEPTISFAKAYQILKAQKVIGFFIQLELKVEDYDFVEGGIGLFMDDSGELIHEQDWWK